LQIVFLSSGSIAALCDFTSADSLPFLVKDVFSANLQAGVSVSGLATGGKGSGGGGLFFQNFSDESLPAEVEGWFVGEDGWLIEGEKR